MAVRYPDELIVNSPYWHCANSIYVERADVCMFPKILIVPLLRLNGKYTLTEYCEITGVAIELPMEMHQTNVGGEFGLLGVYVGLVDC